LDLGLRDPQLIHLLEVEEELENGVELGVALRAVELDDGREDLLGLVVLDELQKTPDLIHILVQVTNVFDDGVTLLVQRL